MDDPMAPWRSTTHDWASAVLAHVSETSMSYCRIHYVAQEVGDLGAPTEDLSVRGA